MHCSQYRYASRHQHENTQNITKKNKKIFPNLLSSLSLIAVISLSAPALASPEPFTPTKPSSWKAAAEAKEAADTAKRRGEPKSRSRLTSRHSGAAAKARAAARARTTGKRAAEPPPAARETRSAGGARRGSCGRASWYASGSRTANGERFVPAGLTAAHRTMAFGTRLRVTDPATNRSVTVRVNDRGPFIRGRILDLSRGAAVKLGVVGRGVADICVEVVDTIETADASN